MSRPTHTLKHEHRVIEQGLRALEGLCTRIELGEEIPVEALNETYDFIQIYADRFHHEKEEMHFFPALQKLGMQTEGGPLGYLRHEHHIERKLLVDLGVAINNFRLGVEGSRRTIVELAYNYSRHLLSHMRREDAILFALAEEMLDEEAKSSISQAFAQAQHGLGERTVEHYEEVASTLEKQWAV